MSNNPVALKPGTILISGLHKEVDANYLSFSSTMTLYEAAEIGNLERVQTLVEQGASVEKSGGVHGWTPLCAASDNGHLDVVR